MNCLFKISKIKENTNQIGCVAILTQKELDKLKETELNGQYSTFQVIQDEDLHTYFDKYKSFKDNAIQELMKMKHSDLFQFILKIGNPADNDGSTIAHEIVKNGFVFSFDELLQLGNPSNNYGWTIAHFEIDKGLDFSFEEIMKLGNPQNNGGHTIAHFLADSGHIFSVDELIQLGNPPDNGGFTVAYYMTRSGHNFSDEDDERLNSIK